MPPPVPCAAINSRTDGIAPWRRCVLDASARCENVAVPSSHVGLVSNPLALAVVVDRVALAVVVDQVAQDVDDRTTFDWAGCLRRSLRVRIAS
jgi:hypothetical protein